MNKFLMIIIFSICTLLAPVKANAGLISVSDISYGNMMGGQSMANLSQNVKNMAESINRASSEMMKFGDMLYCSAWHSKAAEWEISLGDVNFFKHKVVALELLLSSVFLLAIGFMITVIAAFYMFDIAFNLSISIVLLPLGIALWPFGWTKNKLSVLIKNIVYYVGLFIFLPLGITIANSIVQEVIASVFGGNMDDVITAFDNDQADLIEEKLSFFSIPFLKIFLSYVVAIRIIPLLADEFCKHFFGGPVAQSPISSKATQLLSKLKQKTVGKVGKYAKDVGNHQFKRFMGIK